MSALDSKLRSQLDSVCQKARERAEEAARSALQKRAVDAAEPHPHFTAAERKLRNRLRARGRQAGDVRRADRPQAIDAVFSARSTPLPVVAAKGYFGNSGPAAE